MRGLLKLTWLEIRIFVREPLGLRRGGRDSARHVPRARPLREPGAPIISAETTQFLAQDLPLFVSIFISINAALSLIAVISIYREGGILKRLRATPLRPAVILGGARAGQAVLHRDLAPAHWSSRGGASIRCALHPHVAGFALAVVVTTVTILCMGFVIASVVGTARFAQLIGSTIFYPMLAVSGMFVPLSSMPRAVGAARQRAAHVARGRAPARRVGRRGLARADAAPRGRSR